MINFISYLESIFGSTFLLLVTTVSFILKGYILINLLCRGLYNTTTKRTFLFLIAVLICSMVSDSAWILALIKSLWWPSIDYRFYLFWVRVAWGFAVIQYQSIALFMESLVDQSGSLNIRQKVFSTISIFLFFLAIGLACFDFNCYTAQERPPIEFFIRTLESYYFLIILMVPSLLLTMRKFRTGKLPSILKKQIKFLLPLVIVPAWISDLLQTFPLAFNPAWQTNSYVAICISTILITYAAFYCARKVVTLRFLNLEAHVQSPEKFNFVDGFKIVLEQLSHVTNISQLGHLTQTFFKEAFDIPLVKTTLYLRKVEGQEIQQVEMNPQFHNVASTVEIFLNNHNERVCEDIKNLKILIYDEIAFSNFYEKNSSHDTILKFLEAINADIFLPIFEKQNLIAYIIIDRHAQPNKFYGDIERDEMLVFASYLSNIINLLQHRNLEMLIQQEKTLKEELYRKHQEINQYKESIRSFLRNSKQKEIGIIFYKNRKFVFANKAAKELIKVNINTADGHHLTKTLKELAQQVEEYNSPITKFTQDSDGNKLVVNGVPNIEQTNVIITVHLPEITDVIKKQIDLLHDPTQWDFLLYLETTESGKLINQLIPGSGEMLLNFKINLLKTALSNKAILLEMPEEDLLPTVEIIHHMSLRETLHILTLHPSHKNNETAIKLFGAPQLFGAPATKSLLEQLDGNGTLFIQNIHVLDLESQEHLAEFIRYGLFKPYKTDQKKAANVRIICSTNQNLQTRVHEGSFSKALFNELKATSVSMPSLLTLPPEELSMLADGFTEQALKTTSDLKNLLELSEKEKNKLAHIRPVSLHELKRKIQHLMTKKSKDNQIFNETQFNPAYQLTDPQLIEAARMGKHALRDPRVMAMLWNKFKSQSKIAQFLQVNRSSVNRRIKEYNLE